MTDRLTDRQRAWIDYYKQGHSAAEAARLAGYRGKDSKSFSVIGAQNLTKLSRYISDRDSLIDAERVANMEEINAFWTETMRNRAFDIKDRLKASELRARAAGGFVDKVDLRGTVDTAVTKLDGILKQLGDSNDDRR